MKTSGVYILAICLWSLLHTACHKTSDNKNTTTTETFADSLKQECTSPFSAAGDSANFYLATAFTPNGDGIDDTYGLIGTKLHFSNFTATVYDTTGTLVYETGNYAFQWDGTNMTTNKQSTMYKFYVLVKYTTTENKTGSAGTYLFLLSTNTTAGCVNEVKADSVKYEFGDQFIPTTGFDAALPSNEQFCN